MKFPESGRFAAVVLTALEIEYQAVREHLTDLEMWEHPAGTLFEIGTIRDTKVRIALAIAGEGNQAAAVVTERACGAFSPKMLLLAGVAGALHSEVMLGDVVVATRIYAYQGGKEDPSGFLVRPRAWEAPHHLEQRARYLTRTRWWRQLWPDGENCGFTIHFKPVLAGEVVFDSLDSSLAELARRHYNDAVAVEMESAGVSLAARLNRGLPVLTIRGISDRADGAKAMCDSAGWPAVAAARAAVFALSLVANTETQVPGMISGLMTGSAPLILRPAKTIPDRRQSWQRHAFVNHDRLFGADHLIETVRNAIVSHTAHEVVSLFGEGGIGKTAVAYSAIAEAVAEGAFSRVAWLSLAQPEVSAPGVLRDLTARLGLHQDGDGSLRPDERMIAVIDGLEAVRDAAVVVNELRRMGMVRPHKLLVTTRWQLRAEMLEATEFRLRPLGRADAVALIRHAGAEDRLLGTLGDSILQQIIEMTGGNPLLLKMVIGHYLSSHLPLAVVLDSFHDGHLPDLVRTHLFGPSLDELRQRHGTGTVKALLSCFCAHAGTKALTYEELASALEADAGASFPAILVDACRLALVVATGDRGPDGDAHRVYEIPVLLHELVCGCRPAGVRSVTSTP